MDEEILAKYRELRQPHISLYTGSGARYHYQVRAEQALKYARYHVQVTRQWAQAEADGLVRLRTEPDYCVDFADLAGDCFDPTANPNIQPHILAKQEREYRERINWEGVWVLIGEYKCRCCGAWRVADSVGGIVGQDYDGVDLDIKAATLDMLPLEAVS